MGAMSRLRNPRTCAAALSLCLLVLIAGAALGGVGWRGRPAVNRPVPNGAPLASTAGGATLICGDQPVGDQVTQYRIHWKHSDLEYSHAA
jgi:hypothetical protein